MFLFLTLWKVDLTVLKKAFSKVEDTFVYLSQDCEEVVDAMILSLLALRDRDQSLYRRALKLIRHSVLKTVEPRIEVLKDKFKKKLLEADSSAWEFRGTDYRIVQVSPLYPKSIDEYIQTLGDPLFPIPQAKPPTEPKAKADKDSLEYDSSEEEESDNSDQSSGRENVRVKRMLKSHSKEKKRAESSKSKKPKEKSTSQPKKKAKIAVKDRSKDKESSKPKSISKDKLMLKLDKSRDKSLNKVSSLRGLISPPSTAHAHKSNANLTDQRRHRHSREAPSPEEGSRAIDMNKFGHLRKHHVPTSDPRINRDALGSNHLTSEEDLLNDHIRHVLEGTGKLIPSKRDPPPRLYNKGVIVLIEDLILGAEKADIVKLHVYLSSEFYKEPKRMELLDNIMDVCMYYLHFENTPFIPHVRLVLHILGEYLRSPNLLTMTLVLSEELINGQTSRLPGFFRLISLAVDLTPSGYLDKHVLSTLLNCLERHPASQTLFLLEEIKAKCPQVFDESIARFPELKAIFHGERPVQKERLYLLNSIPNMPEISVMKKVQLALSCCKGNKPFQTEGRSHYRHRKFRDCALAFITTNRFQSDPFDAKGLWLQDLEDCDTLFDAQAMIALMASALNKRHMRLNRATPNDTLITIAEFTRRLLFDPESKKYASDVLQQCLLAMNSNGLGNYSQLFHAQEINILAGV